MKIFKNSSAIRFLFMLCFSTAALAQDTTQQITPGRFNSAAAQKSPTSYSFQLMGFDLIL